MSVNRMIIKQMARKTIFCFRRSGANQTPTVPSPLPSLYGHHTAKATSNPGNKMPPINAPLMVIGPSGTPVNPGSEGRRVGPSERSFAQWQPSGVHDSVPTHTPPALTRVNLGSRQRDAAGSPEL